MTDRDRRFRRRGRLWVPEAPHLILRPTREAELGEAFRVGLAGYVTVELGRGLEAGGRNEVRFRHTQRNLIVDAGLNALGSGAVVLDNFINWCAVGTGTNDPAASDTALQTEIPGANQRTASSGSINDVYSSGPGFSYWSLRRTRLFSESQGNGNLTEIGFFSASSGGVMWMRQRFKDASGDPTVIVKTDQDQLRVTYELRIYSPALDASGSVLISGTSYDWLARPREIDSASAWGGGLLRGFGTWWQSSNSARAYETDALTTPDGPGPAGVGGASAIASGVTYSPYTSGTFYRDGTARWEPGVGNFATGIGAVNMPVVGSVNDNELFQVRFTPKIPKNDTQRLTLNFRVSFGRYP